MRRTMSCYRLAPFHHTALGNLWYSMSGAVLHDHRPCIIVLSPCDFKKPDIANEITNILANVPSCSILVVKLRFDDVSAFHADHVPRAGQV